MLKRIAVAAAPLVLLAACGEAGEREVVAVEPAETERAVAGAAVPGAAGTQMPPVSENALDQVDFTGTYGMAGAGGGGRSTLELDRETDRYTYRDGSGAERSGTFRRLDTNRLMIDDFDGEPAIFSVGDGAIYRLAGETTPYDQITVEGMYRRENAPVPENGPGATTDNVADKRGQ